MRNRRFVLLAACVALAGCASAAGTTQQPGTSSSRRDTSVITADELANINQRDLYSAIQQIRPAFLQTRGVTSTGVGTAPEVLNVYVNGVRSGDVEALKQIQVVDVREVRRLSASEATQRYGTGHTMGAILVTLK